MCDLVVRILDSQGSTFFEKTVFPSPSSHQLPIVRNLYLALLFLLGLSVQHGKAWTLSYCDNSTPFISTSFLLYPEAAFSFQSSLDFHSRIFSTPSSIMIHVPWRRSVIFLDNLGLHTLNFFQ